MIPHQPRPGGRMWRACWQAPAMRPAHAVCRTSSRRCCANNRTQGVCALRCACRHGIRQKNEIARGLVFSFGCAWAWKTKKPLRMQRLFMCLVPRRGLEPPRCYSLVPETSASTNSATWAFRSASNYRMFFGASGELAHFFENFVRRSRRGGWLVAVTTTSLMA